MVLRSSILFLIVTILLSCSNQITQIMTNTESDAIVKEVKAKMEMITQYSEKAQLDSFLKGYDNSPDFLAISADGKMRNCEEFKMIATEYYGSLKEQKVVTLIEKYHVIDKDLVISGWTGNITAQFKNGDTMIMKNYSITSVLRKFRDDWKIIHSHESSLPPAIIKKDGAGKAGSA